MGANTKIEWAHHTFNPWIGCSKVSPGCQNCYAEEMMDKRYGRAQWGPGGTRVRTSDANWKKPFAWDKAAAAAGERHRVFCASLADVFEDRQELLPWRADLIDLIDATPNLDWLLLTKRPENITKMLHMPSFHPTKLRTWPMPNVWIGTSVENQEQADKRIPELLKIPAKVRFLSMEPLLGPVDLSPWLARYRSQVSGLRYRNALAAGDHEVLPGIDWVIVGGESGHNARPIHPDWARSLRDQCQEAEVPFFFKQWGEWAVVPSYKDDRIRRNEDVLMCVEQGPLPISSMPYRGRYFMRRVGKQAAGRELDGLIWQEVPSGKVATSYHQT